MRHGDQGYSIFDHVFERAEMACTLEALAKADMARTKAGARHVLTVPVVRELANDPRLVNIAAIPPGLMVCNCLAWCIPQARRVFEREAVGFWHASFRESQADLAVMTMYVTGPGLLVGAIGTLSFPSRC